ncbi:hypothetical protein [Embleya sp. NPDC001921]
MQQWVTVSVPEFGSGYYRFRELVGEVLDADATDADIDDGEVRVRVIGPRAEDEIVITDHRQVKPIDDLAGTLRTQIARDHETLENREIFAFFVERIDLPGDDPSAEWDAFLAHETQVKERVDALKADALGAFDQRLAGLPAAELMAAISANPSRLLPDTAGPRDGRAHDSLDHTPEERLLAAIDDVPLGPSRWERAQERMYVARAAADERPRREWVANIARAEGHAALRAAAAERVRQDRPVIERRFRDEWGVELPDSIFTCWEFLLSLGPVERQTFEQDLNLNACGILDFFDDPDWSPAECDPRMHRRYYWDPPEFLIFLEGGYPGEHYGLWFDDGRTCAGVVGHSPKDASDFGLPGGVTPLQVVRDRIETCVMHDDGDEPERSRRLWLLRRTLMEYETAEWPETGREYELRPYPHAEEWYHSADTTRITTLDGAGALVTGETVLARGPQRASEERALTERIRTALTGDEQALEALVAEAKRRCAAGDPAEALALGRDLHFVSDDGAERRSRIADRERHAAELLAMAYRALGRDMLAELAELDYRERELPYAGAWHGRP